MADLELAGQISRFYLVFVWTNFGQESWVLQCFIMVLVILGSILAPPPASQGAGQIYHFKVFTAAH